MIVGYASGRYLNIKLIITHDYILFRYVFDAVLHLTQTFYYSIILISYICIDVEHIIIVQVFFRSRR